MIVSIFAFKRIWNTKGTYMVSHMDTLHTRIHNTYMHTSIYILKYDEIYKTKNNNKHELVNGRKWFLMICKHTSLFLCVRIIYKKRQPPRHITSTIRIHFNAFSIS